MQYLRIEMKILDIEQKRTSYVWVKIGFYAGTASNLYLLGLRVGGLMTTEIFDEIK